MAIDLYSSCPCGSGKKFKWCCAPIHEHIDKAFQQDEDGQREVALRTMHAVTEQHPDNPEAWGRLAELLFRQEKPEEAEAMLDKAFALNRDYAFGHLLKGHFRQYEGEIPGALMLFRRATELYDPEAKSLLSQVYLNIFDCEMRLNHPVAAHFAAEKAMHLSPTNSELRSGLETVFGNENPNFPAAAKKQYRYLPAPESAGGERRAAWDRALRTTSGKLIDAIKAFETLVREDETDAPAWYNLALSQAWNGNQHAAVDALERYVTLEQDLSTAEEAWALAEVLLCGQGMEDRANWVEHSVFMPLANPQQFVEHLAALEQGGMLFGVRADQENGVLSALLLEKPGPALTAELEAKQPARLAAHMVMMGNLLRLWSTNKERVESALRSLTPHVGPGIEHANWVRGPVKFQDIFVEHFIFPRAAAGEQESAAAQLRDHLQRQFEESWIHQPVRTLGNVPPIDAAGHGTLSKKLRGLLRFMEEEGVMVKLPYDFSRLRKKLGLEAGGQPQAGGKLDLQAMNAAELAGLDVTSLEPAQLEDAFQSALKLDAREVAGQFARELVSRPARAERPDRYPWFNHLVQMALSRGDTGTALDHINEGEKDDCEQNEGRRRNDYEFRRGQVHARAGQWPEAQDVFDRLIARVPDELRFRVGAAEAMLSGKQSARAKTYALAGLDHARKLQNRDLEGHFQELAHAAEKMA